MKHFLLGVASVLTLAACDPVQMTGRFDGPEPGSATCDVRPGCSFDLSPLRVLPDPVVLPRRPYKFFPTAQQLNFRDGAGRSWVAPERTLTDGASIPRVFVSIVGDPTSREFIRAAAVHDAYCGIGNENGPNYHRAYWEDVHIMFYDGLLAGGTQPVIAKVMFAAVWLGGPRWTERKGAATLSTQGAVAHLSTQGTGLRISCATSVATLDHVPAPALQHVMRLTKAYIESENPSIPELLVYLRWQQRHLLTTYPLNPSEDEEVEFLYEESIYQYDPALGQ